MKVENGNNLSVDKTMPSCSGIDTRKAPPNGDSWIQESTAATTAVIRDIFADCHDHKIRPVKEDRDLDTPNA